MADAMKLVMAELWKDEQYSGVGPDYENYRVGARYDMGGRVERYEAKAQKIVDVLKAASPPAREEAPAREGVLGVGSRATIKEYLHTYEVEVIGIDGDTAWIKYLSNGERTSVFLHYLTPRHEAPTEGAGEPMSERDVRQWIDACNHEPGRQVLRDYLALRNRTSEPEAVEFPYQRTFNAISDAVKIEWTDTSGEKPRHGIGISVAAFQKSFNGSARPAPATADKLRGIIDAATDAVLPPVCDVTGNGARERASIQVEIANRIIAALNEQPQ